MQLKKNSQFYSMLFSMVLLAVFLLAYMSKNYKAIESDLRKQAQLNLENAFKTAENQHFDKMFIELKGFSFLAKSDSSFHQPVQNERRLSMINIDTLKTSTVKAIAITSDPTFSPPNLPGKTILNDSKISVKINLKSDSLKIDTSFFHNNETDLRHVKALFDANIKKAGLNINYFITEDSLKKGHHLNPEYCEIFSSKEYYLNIDGNFVYIFKKLLADIILSLLLFLAVGFAFYHIMTSYRKNQEIFDLKEDFIRNMTHELKTPLATMGVAIEALQNFEADGDKNIRDEYLRIAETENHKLNNLVDKVLSISNHIDNQTENTQLTHLTVLVDEILQAFKLRLDQKHIQTKVVSELNQDQHLIHQQVIAMALHNLIDNAIKYINAPSPVINIHLKDSYKEITIMVSDNGSPIEDAHRSRIFEKFYRIPHGNIHDVKGHGLGLYIVQKLITSVKGSIRLETNDQGNHFIIQFPVT